MFIPVQDLEILHNIWFLPGVELLPALVSPCTVTRQTTNGKSTALDVRVVGRVKFA